jgi:Zn-dependent M28 family amino/carboxypeptidase
MRYDVTYLAETIGERNTYHPAELAKAEEYISGRLSKLGYSIRLETYSAGSVNVSNIEATLTGQAKPHEIIVIGAHHDSAPGTPGADDNASGVAVLLEIARHFKDLRPERTIRFVAFVNEEPPYFQTDQMGSHVYARGCKQRHEKIVGMLCLESLGYYSSKAVSQLYPPPLDKLYPNTGDYIAFCGDVASYPLLRRCIKHFRTTTQFPSEGLVAPDKLFSVGWSDHWAFWQAGYPAIMITDTAYLRNPHYHLPSDIPETLDYGRMARVAEGLKQVVQMLTQ